MMEIIPAIDIIEGKCVRLTRGDYDTKRVYNEDPLEVAQAMESAGCRRLHLVDLDGAKAAHIVNYRTLERLASRTSLTIDFGGGLKSDDVAHVAFESGAAMITGGSVAVKSPELFRGWIARYGADRIILGADVKNKKIATVGWTEDSGIDLMPFVRGYMERDGVRNVITTDIACDGMLEGAAVDLYKEMLEELPGIVLTASGGIGSLADVESLDAVGVPSVIVGKAIYEGRISLKDVERINMNCNAC